MKKIFLLLLITISFSSCEKDDICDASNVTTPQVVISFYDKTITSSLKAVDTLTINVTGFETKKYYAKNSIKIPMKTTADAVDYNFTKNGTSSITDVLNFTYSRENIFVSRACGYKTIFNLTNDNSSILTLDGSDWIDHIEIVKPKIENENETHIKIYF